jgi:uncharacterized spore protein YtfJ
MLDVMAVSFACPCSGRKQQKEAVHVDAGNILQKVSDHLTVRRAFGAAYEQDGTLIIPVALVAGGGGGGTSRSGRDDPREGDAASHDAASHDAASHDAASHDAASQDAAPQDPRREDGGGFGGLVLPSGVYVVKGDQVRWIPAVDTTIVVLASLALARLLARAWTRRRG